MEITSGVAELSVKVRRDALARYGLNVSDVEEAVAAGASGDVISEVVDGQKRYSPSQCLGTHRVDVIGSPDPQHISPATLNGRILTCG